VGFSSLSVRLAMDVGNSQERPSKSKELGTMSLPGIVSQG